MLKENGLELKQILSKIDIFPEIKDFKGTISNYFNTHGFAVAYLTYDVLIGRVINGEFEFYQNKIIQPDYLLKLRIFNAQKELFLWQTDTGLKGRLRIDEEGTETYVVDACQVLWGTDKKKLTDGWSKLFEERGTELILPFTNFTVDNRKNRVFIKTRNYIQFHPITCLATYSDCRFIEFLDSNKKPLQ
ncbi:type III-D CRISPR-associated protein Csx19 [Thermodesulfovibrio sp. TK110]